MAKSKLPSFQFYPGDWMKDPALAICSAGARGVWMDVLCLMFESPERGYLLTNGKPWTLEQIAVAIRGDWQENLIYLKELVHNGVMKQAPAKDHNYRRKNLAFFSSRIVSDDRQREAWRAKKRRQRVENKRSLSPALSPFSSSSSSSSSSNLNTKTPLPPASGGLTHDDLLKDRRNYGLLDWRGEDKIIIRTNGKRRIFTRPQEQELSIVGIVEYAIERIRGWGYWCEKYVPTPKAANA